MPTNIFHYVYPFAVTALVMLDGSQVGFHSDYVTESKRVFTRNFCQSAWMKGPSIVAAFVLHTNIAFVCNSVHRANLDFRLESYVT